MKLSTHIRFFRIILSSLMLILFVHDTIGQDTGKAKENFIVEWEIHDTIVPADTPYNIVSVLINKKQYNLRNSPVVPQNILQKTDNEVPIHPDLPIDAFAATMGYHAGLLEGFYIIKSSDNMLEVYYYYRDEGMVEFEQTKILSVDLIDYGE